MSIHLNGVVDDALCGIVFAHHVVGPLIDGRLDPAFFSINEQAGLVFGSSGANAINARYDGCDSIFFIVAKFTEFDSFALCTNPAWFKFNEMMLGNTSHFKDSKRNGFVGGWFFDGLNDNLGGLLKFFLLGFTFHGIIQNGSDAKSM